jgi:galactose oxidase
MRARRSFGAATRAILFGFVVMGCRETQESAPTARPDVPLDEETDGSTLASIDLVYVCGNKFLATNATHLPVRVTYRVAGTQESGTVTLSEAPNEDPAHSETEIETRHSGAVELYQNDERVARRANGGAACGAPAISASVMALASGPASAGGWTVPFAWPIVAVHLTLLPNGKVLSWGRYDVPQVWNPATGVFTPVPSPSLIFCAGQTLLPDGRVFVAGGHIASDRGLPNLNIFDPSTETWSSGPAMALGRWYPTTTTLGNGEILTVAGRDQTSTNVLIPEVWTGATWRKLSAASRTLPYYPRMFLAPDGRVFMAGERQKSMYLTTSTTGKWSGVGNRLYGVRDYGSAVMYEPGKILYAGGGRTTNTAEIIDLNQATPTWQWTGSMAFARRHLNATVLPTGDVLVTGGTGGTAFIDESKAVHAAELWNPTTGAWTTLANNASVRSYHGTSILLPDGRVLNAGSGDGSGATDQYNAELFSPPYLFAGARPVITSAPSSISYGQTFFIGKTDTTTVGSVVLVRLGATTHAFDENQRRVPLSFTGASGGLTLTSPTSHNVAPPGHYMLFVVSGAMVPSVARIVRLN